VESQELAEGYDEKYRQSNYFQYRVWLYRPFVRALAKRAKLRRGGRLLDAGCGQGFFTSLFAGLGFKAVGVDISAAGVSAANQAYHSSGASFKVGNVLQLECRNEFDCVFSRSCSLYNSEDFETKHGVTDRLLTYVRPGGILIFDYYSRLDGNRKPKQWIYHSLGSVQKHFSRYAGTEVYFSLRFDALFLANLALTRPVTTLTAQLSRRTGIGGELLALVRKEPGRAW
jgi:2-polyprenyl-3-methyl-5-hydroxy-6-metoxy-1,4-benzoquinol methylase